jgi:hypothetical protein
MNPGALDERADPLFVDAASGDFHLQIDSPAHDSGLDAGVREDFNRASRPQGMGFDRGAYEFIEIPDDPGDPNDPGDPEEPEVPSRNHAPIAASEHYTTPADAILTILAPGLLANDHDADGDTLSARLATSVTVGHLSLQEDGSFTYAPTSGFSGTVSFSYSAFDSQLESTPAAVTITVSAPETETPPPVSMNDRYSTREATLLQVNSPGVLENDEVQGGNDGGAVLEALLVDNVQQGILTLNGDGSFDYQPNAGFAGEDHFTYRARFDELVSEVVTVTILVEEEQEGETHMTFMPKVTR